MTTSSDELLRSALTGDEGAYRDLVEPYRTELHAYCYRMLGSLDEIDDALQEALLRAWRGLAGFQGRSSLRSWLYRIATNVCLDLIAQRGRRAELEPYPDALLLGSAPSPEARYEQRESVELAFTVALRDLTPQQRAVLIMRDVLGFSANEVAGSLDTSPVSVTSALARARQSVQRRRPVRSQQATLRSLGSERLRELVAGYAAAWEKGDVSAIVAMLTEDAHFTMPPGDVAYDGHAAITEFLRTGPLTVRWRFIPVQASGQVAFGTYSWDSATGSYRADALDVLTLRDDRVSAITAFRLPELFDRFGLPAAVVR